MFTTKPRDFLRISFNLHKWLISQILFHENYIILRFWRNHSCRNVKLNEKYIGFIFIMAGIWMKLKSGLSVTSIWKKLIECFILFCLPVVPRGWTVWNNQERIWVQGAGVLSPHLLPGNRTDPSGFDGALTQNTHMHKHKQHKYFDIHYTQTRWTIGFVRLDFLVESSQWAKSWLKFRHFSNNFLFKKWGFRTGEKSRVWVTGWFSDSEKCIKRDHKTLCSLGSPYLILHCINFFYMWSLQAVFRPEEPFDVYIFFFLSISVLKKPGVILELDQNRLSIF